MAGMGPRPCEKVIATNEQAIFCHWLGLRQCKEFGRAAVRAIELLVLVWVRSYHTASGNSTRSEPPTRDGSIAPLPAFGGTAIDPTSPAESGLPPDPTDSAGSR
jgi:hypothetical protein